MLGTLSSTIQHRCAATPQSSIITAVFVNKLSSMYMLYHAVTNITFAYTSKYVYVDSSLRYDMLPRVWAVAFFSSSSVCTHLHALNFRLSVGRGRLSPVTIPDAECSINMPCIVLNLFWNVRGLPTLLYSSPRPVYMRALYLVSSQHYLVLENNII